MILMVPLIPQVKKLPSGLEHLVSQSPRPLNLVNLLLNFTASKRSLPLISKQTFIISSTCKCQFCVNPYICKKRMLQRMNSALDLTSQADLPFNLLIQV